MTDITEAVTMEEGITEAVTMEEGAAGSQTDSEEGLRQRSTKKLSVASKAYDTDHTGQLDEAQRRMRELDKSGRGFIKNEELYEEFRQNLQTQKELLSLKRLVYVLIALVIIISLATLGTSFAAAILAKDTTTTNGVLVVKGDGEAVATQSNGETFLVTVETEEERRRRHLQVIDDGNRTWETLTVALYNYDFIPFTDAQSIEDKCDLGRTVYLLRECPESGHRNHIYICGPGAGNYESGDAPADEVPEPSTKYSYANGNVVLLCPKNVDTLSRIEYMCSVSVNANYVAPCSAGTPTMTNDSIKIATTVLKNNPTEFATLYGPVASWDTSSVTDMSRLFASVSSNDFCGIATWDVSNVVDMSFMFDDATSFECDLGAWNVENVETFQGTFRDAPSFTGRGLPGWAVSSATTMRSMFDSAQDFNKDISPWDVSKVSDFGSMFYGASAFSHSLCSWGAKMDAEADVRSMFNQATSCASQEFPDLTATPVGPLCAVCA